MWRGGCADVEIRVFSLPRTGKSIDIAFYRTEQGFRDNNASSTELQDQIALLCVINVHTKHTNK